ncbi:DUF2332 domain-containing protein [Pseudolysinimonas yzui]|uniref:DUF2332 domain-containing protein n=1 Tax=Pseudolysinimonas yzui TaxID=2708254 RepID=A0A8J3M1G1_9MICO|nr:DUF2332 domain-containing protein [Pseudolysinimonas yzui]GHF18545.1 hypothetical protein GCM10011600_19360 [Pseudolysinimonas yzui]
MTDDAELIDRYRWFVDHEVTGSSPTYAGWAEGVIVDDALRARLVNLPRLKRQPHLLFAAVRFAGAPLAEYEIVGPWIHAHWDDVVAVMSARATQTNEAARCGALLPVLSAIDGPIALIEVGASAGLCLVPDRYSYVFQTPQGETMLTGDPGAPVIPCVISGVAPPTRHPEIVWRAGIDLNPLDVSDRDDARWLELLVWPEHADRLDRLRAARAVVAADPVRIVRGDLVEALPALAAEAPTDATLVVMHTAVLNYLEAGRRQHAVDVIRGTGARWISQEGIAVIDEVRDRLPEDLGMPSRYVLALDGIPQALTGFHGGSYEAIQPR